ncbi:MAG: hypothetical protein ACI3XG_11405, partial [Faecousia sp.]
METKEKNREKKAPAGQRKPSAGKAPARPKPKQPASAPNGDYEVYIPDAESQQVRYDSGDGKAPAGKTRKAPAQQPKGTSQKRTSRNQEAAYRPYRQA